MGSQSTISSGPLRSQTSWGDYNNHSFVIQQALAKMQTSTLVRIDACNPSAGTVDATPLINQVDSNGNPVPHITIHGLPYLRVQGGAAGIILDPQPGDIGVAVFASRDISKVKSTRAQANPGSHRSYDFADGMYLGGMLNAAPTQYIQFAASGITIIADSIKAGSSPVPVVSQPFLTWITQTLIPTLAAHGITMPSPPPANSLTSTFEAT